MSNAQLEIRPFDEDDLLEVVGLWEDVFSEDPPWNAPRLVVARKLRVQRDLFLVGCLDGRLVATVLAGFDGFRGWVYHLAVISELRQRGFGRQMMEAAEARLRELGCPKVNLQVRSSNQAVIDFYENLGYGIEARTSMGKHLDWRRSGCEDIPKEWVSTEGPPISEQRARAAVYYGRSDEQRILVLSDEYRVECILESGT